MTWQAVEAGEMALLGTDDGPERWIARRRVVAAIAAKGRSATDSERRLYNTAAELPQPERDRLRQVIVEVAGHNAGPPGRRRCVAVDGDYKAGKSDLVYSLMLEYWRDVSPLPEHIEHDGLITKIHPVFFAEVTSGGERDLMVQICEAMSVPVANSDSATDLVRRVAKQCHRSRTRFGVMDDVNHSSKSTHRQQLTAQYKNILDQLPVTLIFVGKDLPESPLFRATTSNSSDIHAAQQLSRRASYFKLEPIPGTENGHAQWVDLFWTASTTMLLHHGEPDVNSKDMAWLFDTCQGSVGDLYELITLAATAAVGTTERITGALLRETRLKHPNEPPRAR